MLLAIVIGRLFPEVIIRRTYAKTLSNSHLSVSSAFLVYGWFFGCLYVNYVCEQ